MKSRRIAVVGAGVAGLTCARALAGAGVSVTVFDKGRSVGGRLATRRIPPHAFDLGAQYFTARSPRFAALVRAWNEASVCALWKGRVVALDGAGGAPRPVEAIDRWVGTPGMSALAREVAKGLDVRTSHRVDRIERKGELLSLSGTSRPGATLGPTSSEATAFDDFGAFDHVVSCLPSNQAAPLVEGLSPHLAAEARAVPLEPCFAVGWVVDERDASGLAGLPFDGAFVGREGASPSSSLSWVARDSSKPGRPPGDRWVLHATATWSRDHFDAAEADVLDELTQSFASLFGLGTLRTSVGFVRRWAFAKAPHPLEIGALVDDDARLSIGGDWASGGRVEGAFLSGCALADRLLAGLEERG